MDSEEEEDDDGVSLEMLSDEEEDMVPLPPPLPSTGAMIDPAQAETQLQLQTPSPASKVASGKCDETPELDEKIARLEPLAFMYVDTHSVSVLLSHCPCSLGGCWNRSGLPRSK